MLSLQLETLAKDYSVALSKIRCLSSVQRLAQDLSAKKSARKEEYTSNLELVGKEFISAKAQLEESWMKKSAARFEKKSTKNMEDLLAWRSSEIDGLIRRSLLDQGTYDSSSSEDAGVQLIGSHAADVAALNESITKHQTENKEIKGKLSNIAYSKDELRGRVRKAEEELRIFDGKIKYIADEIEHKKLSHKSLLDETSNRIEGIIQTIVRRRYDIEQQVKDATEKYGGELRRVRSMHGWHFVVVLNHPVPIVNQTENSHGMCLTQRPHQNQRKSNAGARDKTRQTRNLRDAVRGRN
jgi:chromosome segregation ATPase